MATRYYPRRPAYAYQGESDWERGAKAAGGLSSGLVELASVIAQQREQQRQDAIANQLLNTQTPPRAALVDLRGGKLGFVPGVNAPAGVDPNAPVPTAGTPPATGGVAEVTMRQKAAQADLADQLKRAQIEEALAKARGTGAYAKTPPGQLTAYQQERELTGQRKAEETQRQKILAQAQKTQAASTDTFEKLDKDFKAVYGKDASANVMNALMTGGGTRGNIVNGQFIPDPNGTHWTYDAEAAKPSAGGLFGWGAGPKAVSDLPKTPGPIPVSDLAPFIERFNRIKAGAGKAVPPLVARAAPVTLADVAGAPVSQADVAALRRGGLPSTVVGGGDYSLGNAAGAAADQAANLPSPSSQDEYDALPSGSQFVDGDGQTKTKP